MSPCRLYPPRTRKLTFLPRVSLHTCMNLPDKEFVFRFAMAYSSCGITSLKGAVHVDSIMFQTSMSISVCEHVVRDKHLILFKPSLARIQCFSFCMRHIACVPGCLCACKPLYSLPCLGLITRSCQDFPDLSCFGQDLRTACRPASLVCSPSTPSLF